MSNPTVKTLKEVVDLVNPKSICLLLEVKLGHTFDDPNLNMYNVDRIDHALDLLEEYSQAESITNFLVALKPAPEGHAQILPNFVFIDPKVDWNKAKLADLTVIYLLDGKFMIVKGGEVLPYTKVE